MSPSKESIEEALDAVDAKIKSNWRPVLEPEAVLASAFRASETRAELWKRQYQELVDWWKGDRPAEEYKNYAIGERHAREQEAIK